MVFDFSAFTRAELQGLIDSNQFTRDLFAALEASEGQEKGRASPRGKKSSRPPTKEALS